MKQHYLVHFITTVQSSYEKATTPHTYHRHSSVDTTGSTITSYLPSAQFSRYNRKHYHLILTIGTVQSIQQEALSPHTYHRHSSVDTTGSTITSYLPSAQFSRYNRKHYRLILTIGTVQSIQQEALSPHTYHRHSSVDTIGSTITSYLPSAQFSRYNRKHYHLKLTIGTVQSIQQEELLPHTYHRHSSVDTIGSTITSYLPSAQFSRYNRKHYHLILTIGTVQSIQQEALSPHTYHRHSSVDTTGGTITSYLPSAQISRYTIKQHHLTLTISTVKSTYNKSTSPNSYRHRSYVDTQKSNITPPYHRHNSETLRPHTPSPHTYHRHSSVDMRSATFSMLCCRFSENMYLSDGLFVLPAMPLISDMSIWSPTDTTYTAMPCRFAFSATRIVFCRLMFENPSVTTIATFGTPDLSPLLFRYTLSVSIDSAPAVFVRPSSGLKYMALRTEVLSLYLFRWKWTRGESPYESRATRERP